MYRHWWQRHSQYRHRRSAQPLAPTIGMCLYVLEWPPQAPAIHPSLQAPSAFAAPSALRKGYHRITWNLGRLEWARDYANMFCLGVRIKNSEICKSAYDHKCYLTTRKLVAMKYKLHTITRNSTSDFRHRLHFCLYLPHTLYKISNKFETECHRTTVRS